jgi:hypothetical protein
LEYWRLWPVEGWPRRSTTWPLQPHLYSNSMLLPLPTAVSTNPQWPYSTTAPLCFVCHW